MSQRNLETVRRVYELAAVTWADRGDQESAAAILDLFDPELVIEEVANFPDRSVYHGHEGLARWWAGFFDVYEEVTIAPRDLMIVEDRVVAQVHLGLRSKMGVALEQDMTHVWTLRDGKVVHVTGYNDRADALAAAGLDSAQGGMEGEAAG